MPNEQVLEDGGDAGAERGADASGTRLEGEAEEASAGAAEIRGARAPRQPSDAEREEHNRTHQPPRRWCKHCVAARCVAEAHCSGGTGSSNVPILSFDYC